MFGIPLPALLSPGEAIPRILDRLFKTIEMNWIYTEGLYRKGGAAAKIRDLIRDLNTGRWDSLYCNKLYCFHVV